MLELSAQFRFQNEWLSGTISDNPDVEEFYTNDLRSKEYFAREKTFNRPDPTGDSGGDARIEVVGSILRPRHFDA